jgi:hypothetical protein
MKYLWLPYLSNINNKPHSHTLSKSLLTSHNIKHISSRLSSAINISFINSRFNDIADETIGLCRLFADDTSIGEKSYEINSLCNMVNTDLKYISQ